MSLAKTTTINSVRGLNGYDFPLDGSARQHFRGDVAPTPSPRLTLSRRFGSGNQPYAARNPINRARTHPKEKPDYRANDIGQGLRSAYWQCRVYSLVLIRATALLRAIRKGIAMNQVRLISIPFIRSIEEARSELPCIQDEANKILKSQFQTKFQCRMHPTAIVEVFAVVDPQKVEFRHDTNWAAVELGERASCVLEMPRRITGLSDEEVVQVLARLIRRGIPKGHPGWIVPRDPTYFDEVAHLAAFMLEPVRRVAINRRRGE